MLISYKWLQEYVDINVSAQELAHRLTNAGVAVDNIYDLSTGLDNCLVGKLLSVKPHQNSDHLVICQVDLGSEQVQIVTGAPNVRAGQTVPVACVGAKLPNGVKIKASSLRGEVSNGMLISLNEIGYDNKVMHPEEREGIFILPDDIAAPGTPLVGVLDRDDVMMELDLTPNRADCSSYLGLAYEVSALLGTAVRMPQLYRDTTSENQVAEMVDVKIIDRDLCSRYSTRIFKEITGNVTPLWMQMRLRHSGMRPISLLVDIANYVMLEVGQPLHTFDYEKIGGQQIIVRKARTGEMLKTLDGIDRTLQEDQLMICDQSQPIAIAGVMGGFDSEVTSATELVLLEAANFYGPNIRHTSRILGLSSEASGRYSKGIEQAKVELGLNRFAYLVEVLKAGTIIPGVVTDMDELPDSIVIKLRPERVCQIAGAKISTNEMIEHLTRLGLGVESVGRDLLVTAPARRPDLLTEIDLVEEVLRLHSFDNIKSTQPKIDGSGVMPVAYSLRRELRTLLRAHQANEVVSYAFHDPVELDQLLLPEDDELRHVVELSNPLSQAQSIMRTSLLPGLLRAAKYNLNRQRKGIFLSEVGRVFFNTSEDQLPIEYEMMGLLAGGVKREKSWNTSDTERYDFFTLKGVIESVAAHFNIQLEFERLKRPFLHPGRAALITHRKKPVGYIGEVHVDVVDNLGVEAQERLIYAELNMTTLYDLLAGTRKYRKIIPYPYVERDLAIVVPEQVTAVELLKAIKKAGGSILYDVRIFDLYSGHQVTEGYKSCAFKLTYQAKNRTLTTDEVNEVHDQVVTKVNKQFGAVLR